jgi:HEAT repeat protein
MAVKRLFVCILLVLALLCISAPGNEQARGVEVLIKDLNDENSTVRALAAESLGDYNDSNVIDPLIQAFEDRDPNVQLKASSALVKIGKPTVYPLIHALKYKTNIVREIAASTLGKIDDSSVVDQLTLSLDDSDSNVREEAAYSLGELKDPRAVEPLIKSLKDKDCSVRAEAAWALGEIGDPTAIEPLVQASSDEACWVQSSVSRALGKLGRQYGT